jgi:tRNA nucleotidyltransferase (CCA-adding enzyme)
MVTGLPRSPRNGEDARVSAPSPQDLLDRVRSLPAGARLMALLDGVEGVYLVGGSVRDILLGGRPYDLDLVAEQDPDAVAARLGGELVAHDRFGTATVNVGGFSYDIARARRETYAHPGALPDVAPATLDEDLRRRDVTVNAIALPLAGAHAGELRAVPGALDDLDARLLRVLHDRSFIDDPTRLLRLARYASRLGFEIEPHTRELALGAARDGALKTVSGPRIGAELRLLAREDDPVAALRALRDLELDRAIDPRFELEDEQLARRALELLPEDGRSDRLVLAIASRAVPAGELRSLLDRLGFEAADRDAIVAAATAADGLAGALAGARRPSEIAQVASGAGPELVALAGALGPAEAAREWLGRLRQVRLELDGGDLLAAGVPEGPAVGRGLAAALAAKLDGRAQGREQELAAALEGAGATD